MARLRSFYQTGSILDNPLTAAATSCRSIQFVNLPVVNSPDIIALVLDPQAKMGTPETVWITAHTAGANTVTITRGQEGSSARSHAAGELWEWCPTSYDASAYVCTSTTHPANPFPGMEIFETDTNNLLFWNGSAWIVMGLSKAISAKFTAAVSVPSGATTNIAWATTVWNNGGFSLTNRGGQGTNVSIAVPVVGKYEINVFYGPNKGAGATALEIYQGTIGGIAWQTCGSSGGAYGDPISCGVTADVQSPGTDYFLLQCFQTSGLQPTGQGQALEITYLGL